MKNQVLTLKNTIFKSLLLKDNDLCLCASKISSNEAFEKALAKTGFSQNTQVIPIDKISEIRFNEGSEKANIAYVNEKGKSKKMNLDFGSTEISNSFGHFLGQELSFDKSVSEESKLKPLLLNLLYIIMSIGGTIMLYSIDDTSEITDSGSRRNRGARAIMRLIVETIGQTGVLIVGSLITLFCVYNLYKRYSKPTSEVQYSK